MLIDSPDNGVGVKLSPDLVHWHQIGLYTLGQRRWPWAQGRLSGGQVIDLRLVPGVGKYVMVFHGCTPEGKIASNVHGAASLGLGVERRLGQLVLARMSPPSVDLQAIPGPVILAGDKHTAYRDPLLHFHEGHLPAVLLRGDGHGRTATTASTSPSPRAVTCVPGVRCTPSPTPTIRAASAGRVASSVTTAVGCCA